MVFPSPPPIYSCIYYFTHSSFPCLLPLPFSRGSCNIWGQCAFYYTPYILLIIGVGCQSRFIHHKVLDPKLSFSSQKILVGFLLLFVKHIERVVFSRFLCFYLFWTMTLLDNIWHRSFDQASTDLQTLNPSSEPSSDVSGDCFYAQNPKHKRTYGGWVFTIKATKLIDCTVKTNHGKSALRDAAFTVFAPYSGKTNKETLKSMLRDILLFCILLSYCIFYKFLNPFEISCWLWNFELPCGWKVLNELTCLFDEAKLLLLCHFLSSVASTFRVLRVIFSSFHVSYFHVFSSILHLCLREVLHK